MTIAEIEERIRAINSANGYAYWPASVNERNPEKRLQSVTVKKRGGEIVVAINATGRAFERISQHIADVLNGEQLTIKPMQLEGDDDATTETSSHDGGESGNDSGDGSSADGD